MIIELSYVIEMSFWDDLQKKLEEEAKRADAATRAQEAANVGQSYKTETAKDEAKTTYWSNSRVMKVGVAGDEGHLYVWLKDLGGKHDNYFALDPREGDKLLETALTAISFDLPVNALVGADGNVRNSENYLYCYRLYVARQL